MLLDLDDSLLVVTSEKERRSLNDIVWFVLDGRHSWYPSPDIAMAMLEYAGEHLPTVASWREFFLKAATAKAYPQKEGQPPLPVTVENLRDLAADLGMPAVIVVENSKNDGSLLRALFRLFAPEIEAALKENWLDIVNGGGSNTHVPDEARKKFRLTCRVLVLKDNDKLHFDLADQPDDEDWPPGKPSFHVWWRHEAENYLPDAVLRRCKTPKAHELVEHLRLMKPEQQRMIDMKEGVKKDGKNIFGDLPKETRDLWHGGFGKGSFLDPLVPEDIELTADDFAALGEDVPREFDRLLNKIRRVL